MVTVAKTTKLKGRVVFACLALLVALSWQPARSQDSFDFRAAFVAKKVVRLWFHKQDGIQVWGILEKLNALHTRQLWQQIEHHPYILEVKEDLHGPQKLQMYYGLQQTFSDHLRYN